MFRDFATFSHICIFFLLHLLSSASSFFCIFFLLILSPDSFFWFFLLILSSDSFSLLLFSSLLCSALLFSSLLFSSLLTSAFPSVHIVGSLASKHPSTILYGPPNLLISILYIGDHETTSRKSQLTSQYQEFQALLMLPSELLSLGHSLLFLRLVRRITKADYQENGSEVFSRLLWVNIEALLGSESHRREGRLGSTVFLINLDKISLISDLQSPKIIEHADLGWNPFTDIGWYIYIFSILLI